MVTPFGLPRSDGHSVYVSRERPSLEAPIFGFGFDG
jgi:hypothetical protein